MEDAGCNEISPIESMKASFVVCKSVFMMSPVVKLHLAYNPRFTFW